MNRLTKKDFYYSHVHSILKCQYGWPAMLPDGMTWQEWDNIIAEGFSYGCKEHAIAEKLAQEFAERGGEFSPRIDGEPNTRRPKISELRKLIYLIKDHKPDVSGKWVTPEDFERINFCIANSSLCETLKSRLSNLLYRVTLRNRPLWILMRAEWNLEPLPEDYGDLSEFDEIPF